jgi:dihydrofolate reductase
MIKSLVVAVARNGVIGRDNALPWKLPEEMKYFKRVTMGNAVIMGRRTWESIGKPLAGRTNIVVTRNAAYAAPGCAVAQSLAEAYDVARAAGAGEACVIGGTSLFEEALPGADVLHYTEVEAEVPGDTFFPPFDRSQWLEREVMRHAVDEKHQHPFRVLRMERRR